MPVLDMPNVVGAYMTGVTNNPYKDRVAWGEQQGETARAYDNMIATLNPMQFPDGKGGVNWEEYAAVKSRLESRANANNRQHMNVDQNGNFTSPSAFGPNIDPRYMTKAAMAAYQRDYPVEYNKYIAQNVLKAGQQGPMVPPAQRAINEGIWQNMQNKYSAMLQQQKEGTYPGRGVVVDYPTYVANAVAKQKAALGAAENRLNQSRTEELNWVKSGAANPTGYNVGYYDPSRVMHGSGVRLPGQGEKQDDEDRKGY